MASFNDRQNREWSIILDGPTVEDVEAKHGVSLANLEKDPLQKLRSDPMKLAAVIYLLCQDQIEKLNLSPTDFGKSLPVPPDPMLTAVEEAIVNFFPSGRASHVREVLTSYSQMGSKTDELIVAKMEKILTDKTVMDRLSDQADVEIERALKTLTKTDIGLGT